MSTSERECLAALREAAEKLGKPPTKAEYEDLGLTPASATIIRTVGGWNEAKERAGMETNPSTGSKVQPKPADVNLPAGVSWEELSVDQRWHYRNTEWKTERTLQRRARLRSWINDGKRERGCQRCGVSDPSVLDFHHPNPEQKEMAVGTMVTYGYGKENLEAEMAKCVVLCSNCHRKEHYEVPEGTSSRREQLQRWLYKYKQSQDGCSRCGASDPRSLVFHHVDGEKQATIAKMVSDGRTRGEIRAEIERCVLLCSNCHRREHFDPPQPVD